uniref:Uncharacterized protein n=1 Tax=Anguilla anguilla TaxID=7936 RepID=A0A0E9WD06_ANGAN
MHVYGLQPEEFVDLDHATRPHSEFRRSECFCAHKCGAGELIMEE